MGQSEIVTLLAIVNSVALLLAISLGLAVIFGLTGVINLAHGEFITMGALLTVTGVKNGINIWVAMILASLGVAVAGVLMEWALIRRLRGRLENTLLATWGLSLILVQVAVLLFGTSPVGIDNPMGSFRVGQYSVPWYTIVFDVAAVIMLVVVYVIFTKTRYGITARAVQLNADMAEALGVNRSRVNSATFAIGAGISGASGALLAPIVAVVPTMGQAYVGSAFMTVVVGGAGVISGTGLSSVTLGTVSGTVSSVFTPLIGTLALLGVAIVLLRLMPAGISGRLGRKL